MSKLFKNRKMKLVRILILEDDLLTLSTLLDSLYQLEERLISQKGPDLSVVALSEYRQVEKYINEDESLDFDVVLLDRDCKIGGSFHTLDFDKFEPEQIIGISSVPEYNEALREKGITKIVHKDFRNLDKFARKVVKLVEKTVYDEKTN